MTTSETVRAVLAPPEMMRDPELHGLDLDDENDRGLLIRAQHPDHVSAIEQGENELKVEGEVVNPRLHLAMHEIVATQLWTGDPPAARRAMERLLEAAYEPHEALHMIGAAVATELFSALSSGAPADPDAYAAALDALPDHDDFDELLDPDDLDLTTDEIEEEDEEEFEQTRAWLLEGHRDWLVEHGLDGEDWVAHQLLHYKWAYLDGHLGFWGVAELQEILLGLFPRKVVVEPEDVPLVVPAAANFLRYLDDTGLLAPGSDPLPRLLDALRRMEVPFRGEIADPANFDVGKMLFSGMAADGVDLNDEAAVGAWIEAYNALPEEERKRRLPRRTLPPMVLPDDETLAAQALAAPAMRQLAAFLDWVGDGRGLTQKGNLKLADGKALVALLDTSDRFDEIIGEEAFKTVSTTDLPGVDLVYRLALKARLARKQHGRVQRTKRGSRLAGEALDAWREVVTAMLDIGMIRAGREDHYGLRWWEEHLEEGVAELLAVLAQGGAPPPVEAVREAAYQGFADDYDLDALPATHRDRLPDGIGSSVDRLIARLVWLGAATREGADVELSPWGSERWVGGELALTDLGRWFARPLLLAEGYEVSTTGALADASADTLLSEIGEWPPEAVNAEVRAWATARDAPADELAAAARRASAPDVRALVFEALDMLGEEAVPVVRQLVDDSDLRPWASFWLVQRGEDEPGSFDPADAPAALVQAFAVALLAGGPEAVVEMLSHDTPVNEQLGMLDVLWRADDPYTTPVLEALASGADKKVAKTARKALFKRRSAGSGP